MADPHPLVLGLTDLGRLLNVSPERARQVANGKGFPPPVASEPRRLWDRDHVEAWIDDVDWWGRFRWRKPKPEDDRDRSAPRTSL